MPLLPSTRRPFDYQSWGSVVEDSTRRWYCSKFSRGRSFLSSPCQSRVNPSHSPEFLGPPKAELWNLLIFTLHYSYIIVIRYTKKTIRYHIESHLISYYLCVDLHRVFSHRRQPFPGENTAESICQIQMPRVILCRMCLRRDSTFPTRKTSLLAHNQPDSPASSR